MQVGTSAVAVRPWSAVTLVAFAGVAVGAALLVAMIDASRAYVANVMVGQTRPWIGGFMVTAPSWVSVAVLTPLPLLLVRRAPVDRGRWTRAVPIHVAGAIVFATAHVGLASLYIGWQRGDMTGFAGIVSKMSSTFVVDLMIYAAIAGAGYAVRFSREARDRAVEARVLSAALRSIDADLVVAAVESTDGYTGTLPITVAELLGLPSVTFATSIDVVDGSRLRAERQTAAGAEVVSSPLPVLVTVTTSVAEPRYPSLKGVMAAKSKPLDRPSLVDLGLSAEDLKPSQTVASAEAAPAKAGGRVIEAGPDTAAEIADLLVEARVI